MRFYEQVFGLSKQDLASRLGVSSPKKPDFRPKNGVFRPKKLTRSGLVAKKWSFSPKSDDEKEFRRQKVEFLAQK
ncbi:hypothetical protein NST89_06825 [Caldifermentibacillus hisashii]|uniref:hypothetical protein n=1 Tax=Caldifermentibacillus hisashii TaxID=996558 RepID=UPI0031369058